MKIIVQARQLKDLKDFSDPYFELSELTTGSVKLTRKNTGHNHSIKLSIENLNPFTAQTIYWSAERGFIVAANLTSSRDSDAFYRFYCGCFEGALVSFARGGQDNCALVLYGATLIDGLDVENVNEIMRTSVLLDKFLPGYLNVTRKALDAKITLMEGLSPLDSLSSLEKQVDLLTILVLSLARKQPPSEQPAWLDELEEVFSGTSSVDESDLEAAVKSMSVYKAHIRALQNQYFKDRNG